MKSALLSIFLLLVVSDLHTFCQERTVTLFIRIDDIFMRESHILPMECNEFLKVAENHGAHIMLAVIPARLRQQTNADGKMAEALIDYSRRGHQLVQHGYNHRSEATQSTNWEFYDPDAPKGFQFMMKEKILEGKQMMEAVTGKPVTAYVGPGNDNDFVLLRDEKLFREMGFVWLTDQKTKHPFINEGNAYFFSLDDYAWALTDSNYKAKMDEVKADFLKAAQSEGYFGLLFHDHFTRANYNGGITLRWFDELLRWFETESGYAVQYRTCEEWYNENAK